MHESIAGIYYYFGHGEFENKTFIQIGAGAYGTVDLCKLKDRD